MIAQCQDLNQFIVEACDEMDVYEMKCDDVEFLSFVRLVNDMLATNHFLGDYLIAECNRLSLD